MRTQFATWRSSLCAALGLAVLSCGGQSTNSTGTGGSGGSGMGPGGSGGSGMGPGGSGGSQPGSGGSAASGGTNIELSCQNPQPIIGIDGNETGFIQCEERFLHRRERRDCASIVPRPEPIAISADGGTECTKDEDCAHLLHGHCRVLETLGPSGPSVSCTAGCIRDADCGQDFVCLCGDPVGVCVRGNCQVDADCGAGLLCTSTPHIPDPCLSIYPGDFACQQPNDACRGAGDCPGNESCVLTSSGRICSWQGVCGRPFLVFGELRQAAIVEHATGWGAKLTPSISALDAVSCAALAEHWSQTGLMEHASVAAFARFSLQLLALGAPASLVHAAQQALGDEITHAELCFGLASAYAGRTIEPGLLPMHGALDALSFSDIVCTAISEACIGETLAAAEAAEALEYACDPQVRGVLGRIAADEARHAELGWRFLRWALDSAAPSVRERLSRLASRLAEMELERSAEHWQPDTAPELLHHGVLTNALRHEVRCAALTEVVLPIARALCEEPAPCVQ
jgi:hypothetical protein